MLANCSPAEITQSAVSLSRHTLKMGIWLLLTQLQGEEGCYSEQPKRKEVRGSQRGRAF